MVNIHTQWTPVVALSSCGFEFARFEFERQSVDKRLSLIYPDTPYGLTGYAKVHII